MRRIPLSFLFQFSLILTPAAGSPVPSSTDNEKHRSEKRSFTRDGPLQAWEVAVILLGALFGIMLLGTLGGVCEVLLHGKIKESNAEADAKLEGKGNQDMTEVDAGKMERGGMDGPQGVIDQDRYSWQPERMTTGLSDDSTLAGSDHGASRSDISRGGQAVHAASQNHAQTSGQYPAWNDDAQPRSSSQFVIDDMDSPYFDGGDDNAQFEAYPGHLSPPPAMPKDTGYQHQHTGSDGHTGQSTMDPSGSYSGESYSPAAMPDSADYLAEYRQSQLYLQQDDDWYTAASASYGAPAGTAR